jgi:hypothetical protein
MPFTASHPLHPVKTASRFGVAVRVTTELLLNAAEQVAPQSMPAGLEVTVPSLSRPDMFTVSMNFTVKLLPLVAVPPGVVTLSGPFVAPLGRDV